MAGPAKPGGEDFENFEPPQVSGGLRPARHPWFGFQNLPKSSGPPPKSSGPPPEMFIFYYFGRHFLLHTFDKATGIGPAHVLQIQWPMAAADAGHPERAAFRIVIQTRKRTIAKKLLLRWNQIENLHTSGLFTGKVKFGEF